MQPLPTLPLLLGNVQTHIRLLVKLHVFILGVMKRVADANGILTVPDLVGTEFANRHTQYEMFYNGAPDVALNRMWHFFRWEDVDAQVDRALKSIGNYDDLVGGRKPDDAGGGRRIALTASA